MTLIFIPKESSHGESRVAATPETVAKMVQGGFEVWVEKGAGEAAYLSDEDYASAGGKLASSFREGVSQAELLLKVASPSKDEIANLKRGTVLVSFLMPSRHLAAVQELATAGLTVFAMDLVPRITKAQKMDALSSQANIAGYKAVLLAATSLGKYFPLLMTAAGTVKPSKVVVFGAGVAGLQAIATARRLGAVVEATDIRSEVKEQVESLGARFIEVEKSAAEGEGQGGYAKQASEDYQRRQAQAVAEHVAAADVVITTAQVPGRKAPVLVTTEMVKSMQAGSVIVDLAADQGGNCELTQPGQVVTKEGVTLIGTTNLPSSVSKNASELYARNVLQVVRHLAADAKLNIDLEEEINHASIAIHKGEVRHAPTLEAMKSEGGNT